MSPMQRDRYPADWEAISRRIRFDRAGNCCEWCGIPNGARIHRLKSDPSQWIYSIDYLRLQPWEHSQYGKVITITLTVAHLDHDTTNNDDSNLAALCNRCHLTHDAKYHAENARATRARKAREAAESAGQLELWDGE